jgi:hypothetical protein
MGLCRGSLVRLQGHELRPRDGPNPDLDCFATKFTEFHLHGSKENCVRRGERNAC